MKFTVRLFGCSFNFGLQFHFHEVGIVFQKIVFVFVECGLYFGMPFAFRDVAATVQLRLSTLKTVIVSRVM